MLEALLPVAEAIEGNDETEIRDSVRRQIGLDA